MPTDADCAFVGAYKLAFLVFRIAHIRFGQEAPPDRRLGRIAQLHEMGWGPLAGGLAPLDTVVHHLGFRPGRNYLEGAVTGHTNMEQPALDFVYGLHTKLEETLRAHRRVWRAACEVKRCLVDRQAPNPQSYDEPEDEGPAANEAYADAQAILGYLADDGELPRADGCPSADEVANTCARVRRSAVPILSGPQVADAWQTLLNYLDNAGQPLSGVNAPSAPDWEEFQAWVNKQIPSLKAAGRPIADGDADTSAQALTEAEVGEASDVLDRLLACANAEWIAQERRQAESAKRRGRKQEYDPEKDARLAADWRKARDAGISKDQFCRDRRISVDILRQTLDREYHRRRQ